MSIGARTFGARAFRARAFRARTLIRAFGYRALGVFLSFYRSALGSTIGGIGLGKYFPPSLLICLARYNCHVSSPLFTRTQHNALD